jgi:hypothetical protein
MQQTAWPRRIEEREFKIQEREQVRELMREPMGALFLFCMLSPES